MVDYCDKSAFETKGVPFHVADLMFKVADLIHVD